DEAPEVLERGTGDRARFLVSEPAPEDREPAEDHARPLGLHLPRHVEEPGDAPVPRWEVTPLRGQEVDAALELRGDHPGASGSQPRRGELEGEEVAAHAA